MGRGPLRRRSRRCDSEPVTDRSLTAFSGRTNAGARPSSAAGGQGGNVASVGQALPGIPAKEQAASLTTNSLATHPREQRLPEFAISLRPVGAAVIALRPPRRRTRQHSFKPRSIMASQPSVSRLEACPQLLARPRRVTKPQCSQCAPPMVSARAKQRIAPLITQTHLCAQHRAHERRGM